MFSNLFGRGKPTKTSAQSATERLKVRIEHERMLTSQPDWLPQMQADLIDVIRRYIDIDPSDLFVDLKDDQEHLSVLEMNIPIENKASTSA